MTDRGRVRVVRTSTANLAAVIAAFDRLGREVSVTDDATIVRNAGHVVLPGVGAFGAAATSLERADGLREALIERVEEARPTLGICLGLQLLAEGSEESPGREGLGILPVRATRFEAPGLRVPQMGWNEVRGAEGARLVKTGYAYFANSYCLAEAPPGWAVAWTDYGSPFVAAVEKGSVVACQFHPELSGAYGRRLLENWLQEASC